MYFQTFDKLPNYNGGSSIVDIFTSFSVRYSHISGATQFYTYTLTDGERPEHVAYKLYDDTNLHWIILLMNDIKDPYFDWLQTENMVIANTNDNFDDINAVHHINDLQSGLKLSPYDEQLSSEYFIVNGEYPSNHVPVTNVEYFRALNEEKRNIKVLKIEFVNEFVNQFESQLQ